MVAEMVEKPLTEAQRIVARLEAEFGMAPAAIAREIKLQSHIVNNIKTRHTTGNLQLPRLRRLLSVMEQGPTSSASSNPLNALSFDNIAPDVAPDAAIDSRDDPARLTLNSEDPTPAAAKSLKDKASDMLGAMLGTSSAEPAPKRKASKSDADEQASLIEQLVPLAALLLVMSGSVLLPDPYKPCGPTHGEASAIAYPIIKRAVRELDARKKLSEGTQDAIIILLAVGAYGQRAYGTYRQIRAMEVERARSDNGATTVLSGLAGAGVAGTAAPAAADDPARRARAGSGPSLHVAAAADVQSGTPGRRADGRAGGGDERRGSELLNQLLAADADGRKRLGIG